MDGFPDEDGKIQSLHIFRTSATVLTPRGGDSLSLPASLTDEKNQKRKVEMAFPVSTYISFIIAYLFCYLIVFIRENH